MTAQMMIIQWLRHTELVAVVASSIFSPLSAEVIPPSMSPAFAVGGKWVSHQQSVIWPRSLILPLYFHQVPNGEFAIPRDSTGKAGAVARVSDLQDSPVLFEAVG